MGLRTTRPHHSCLGKGPVTQASAGSYEPSTCRVARGEASQDDRPGEEPTLVTFPPGARQLEGRPWERGVQGSGGWEPSMAPVAQADLQPHLGSRVERNTGKSCWDQVCAGTSEFPSLPLPHS